MKYKHFCLFYFILSVGGLKSLGQPVLRNQPEQDACHAISICGNFTCPYIYYKHGNVWDVPYSGQITIAEWSSVWLKLNIATPGVIVFAINPDVPTEDFNFAVYKNMPCNQVGINYYYNYYRQNAQWTYGPTGLAVDPASILVPGVGNGFLVTPFSDSIHADAGDEYLILISTMNGAAGSQFGGFSLDFTGSTATFTTDSPPVFSEVKNTCNKSQELNVRMSQPVQCGSISPGGSDFYITPPLASVNKAYAAGCSQIGDPALAYPWDVTVQFSTPLPPGTYWLHSNQGTDGNSLLDLCGESQPQSDSISFTVDPYTPITFTGLDSPACQYLVVGLSRRVLWDSIAADGSDFRIVGPSAVGVASALGLNRDLNGLVDTVLVTLSDPIKVPGSYQLLAQIGTDFNSLKDTCGAQMLPGTQISFSVAPFNALLAAAPDTLLCKADTISLRSADFRMPAEGLACGIALPQNQSEGIVMTQQTQGASIPAANFTLTGYRYATPFETEANPKGRKLQFLVLATELQAIGLKPGVITAIGWQENADAQYEFLQSMWLGGVAPPWFNPPIVTYNDFSIKIGCTSLTNFPTGWTTPLNVGQQLVYNTTNYHPQHGINEFVLDAPYVWDGFSNLLIEVCTFTDTLFYVDAFGVVTYPVSLLVDVAKTGFNSCKLYWSDLTDGCTINTSQNFFQDNMIRPVTRFKMTSLQSDGGPYQWSPASAIIGSSSNPDATAFASETTGFTVNTTDRYGCYLKDSITVVVSGLHPSVSPKDTSICIGDQVRIIADAGIDSANFNWVTDQPLSLSCLNCKDPIAAPIDSTAYAVIVSDKYGCRDTVPAVINVMPLPPVEASPKDAVVKYGSSIQLSVTGADFYSWSPGRDLDFSTVDNPVATPREPTDFIVIGLVDYGCRNADTIHIDVDYSNNLFVPSVFSPNGDGKNDLFKIVNLGFEKVQEFRVFNRWGQEVFAAFDNRGWDGTFKGMLQDMGTYRYLIRVGIPNGKSELYKGDVTLIK